MNLMISTYRNFDAPTALAGVSCGDNAARLKYAKKRLKTPLFKLVGRLGRLL
jgi:hypothetical protein